MTTVQVQKKVPVLETLLSASVKLYRMTKGTILYKYRLQMQNDSMIFHSRVEKLKRNYTKSDTVKKEFTDNKRVHNIIKMPMVVTTKHKARILSKYGTTSNNQF